MTNDMTPVIVTKIVVTVINTIVHVRPKSGKSVVFYGWNDAKIKSVTPLSGGVYTLEGQPANAPYNRATVGEIVASFEAMAIEIQYHADQH